MAIRENNIDETTGGPPSGKSPEKKTHGISAFRRALEDYKDAVYQAWRHEDASFRINQVLNAESLRTKNAPDYASYLEQQALLARNLQDAWIPPEFQETVYRSFTEYMDATKAAWAALDSATVTPAELAHIAQLMAQAASLIAIPVSRPGST